MKNIERILVPLDFSDGSRRALAYAAFLAERLNATVDLVHVWEQLAYALPELIVYSTDGKRQTLRDIAKTSAEKEMKRFLDSLEAHGQVRLQCLIESDHTAITICELAKDYDLVVMGTHGRSGIARVVLGSVAAEVVQKAPCPVLTLRADDPVELRHSN